PKFIPQVLAFNVPSKTKLSSSSAAGYGAPPCRLHLTLFFLSAYSLTISIPCEDKSGDKAEYSSNRNGRSRKPEEFRLFDELHKPIVVTSRRDRRLTDVVAMNGNPNG